MQLAATIVLAVVTAALFYLVAEKPFMSSRRRDAATTKLAFPAYLIDLNLTRIVHHAPAGNKPLAAPGCIL